MTVEHGEIGDCSHLEYPALPDGGCGPTGEESVRFVSGQALFWRESAPVSGRCHAPEGMGRFYRAVR